MRILLDTSIFLMLAGEPSHVSKTVKDAIDDADIVLLSSASAWEIAIKASIGKVTLPTPAGEYIRTRMERMSIEPLKVTHAHAVGVEHLPFHHRDPFDRLIIVQAFLEGLTLATTDRVFARYGVPLVESSRKSARRQGGK